LRPGTTYFPGSERRCVLEYTTLGSGWIAPKVSSREAKSSGRNGGFVGMMGFRAYSRLLEGSDPSSKGR
jgi:hypothetical protein